MRWRAADGEGAIQAAVGQRPDDRVIRASAAQAVQRVERARAAEGQASYDHLRAGESTSAMPIVTPCQCVHEYTQRTCYWLHSLCVTMTALIPSWHGTSQVSIPTAYSCAPEVRDAANMLFTTEALGAWPYDRCFRVRESRAWGSGLSVFSGRQLPVRAAPPPNASARAVAYSLSLSLSLSIYLSIYLSLSLYIYIYICIP